MTTGLETPIVFIVFNRPHTTRIVFEAIAKQRPRNLLIVADGPRVERPGEAELCRQVLEIVGRVDWPCDVMTNFAESNLGCRQRVISGLDWAFSLVEEAIILEDDCLPDASFFPFCSQMLEKYRGDSRVDMVAGSSHLASPLKSDHSYYFSRLGHIWGWATWRRAWASYDQHLNDWPEIRDTGLLYETMDDPKAVQFWTGVFESMHNGTGPNTWDYQWLYTSLINNTLAIVPRVNLVTNIGFGPEATHTTDPERAPTTPTSSLSFPLKHPPSLIPMRSLDMEYMRRNFLVTFTGRVRAKATKLGKKLTRA